MTEHPYPLTWPQGKPRTEAHARARARFQKDGSAVSIAEATRRVLSEVRGFTRVGKAWRIDPEAVVISSNLKLRKDGLPLSSQREPDDVGIAVYLQLDGAPHCFPCDAWDRVADNIAAVAAHLGALRGMERWGVGNLKEAFTGWAMLEHKPDESWFQVLNVPEDAPDSVVVASYKRLRSAYHPDKLSGGQVQFMRIQSAYEQYQKIKG